MGNNRNRTYHGKWGGSKLSEEVPCMSLCQTLIIHKPYRIMVTPTIPITKFTNFNMDCRKLFTSLAIFTSLPSPLRNPRYSPTLSHLAERNYLYRIQQYFYFIISFSIKNDRHPHLSLINFNRSYIFFFLFHFFKDLFGN